MKLFGNNMVIKTRNVGPYIDKCNPLASDNLSSNSSEISFFEYLYVFVLIIYGGGANIFVRSFSPDKPLAILLPLGLSVILALKSRIVFNKQIYLLLLGYVLYFAATVVKYKTLHLVFFGQLLVSFLVVYVTIKGLRFNFFLIYERILYYLAITSLVMWLIQLVLGGDTLLNLIGRIPSVKESSVVTGGGLNIIFYSVQPYAHMLVSFTTIPRNCGFAWEPGGFAVYLNLAIFINVFFYNSDKKFNLRFWVLLLALISSQSTTGYVIFILMMVFYLLQKQIKIIILLFPVLIIVIALMFSLPFMRDKILLYIEETSQVDRIIEESIGKERSRNPQRFASFVIAFRDFKNNPILGFAGQSEDRWYIRLNSNVSPISGIGNLMAQYGLVGLVFFMTLLIRSSSAFSRYFNFNGWYLFFLIMLMITISYSIIFMRVIMSFWMFSFFESCNREENKPDNNNES